MRCIVAAGISLTQLSVFIEFDLERISLGKDPSFLGQKNTLMKLFVRSIA